MLSLDGPVRAASQILRFTLGSALIAAFSLFSATSMAAPLVTPQQLTVTAANATGGSIYDLSLTTGSSGALISGILGLNSDGAKHGAFAALAWAPNAVTGTLDLIAADTTKGQILRYAGPTYGASSVIFTYAGKGSGPAYPAGLTVDGAGNLFVISASAPINLAPAVWVLPFNKTSGAYGAPVLIDQTFSGVRTLALAEVLIAGSAATPEGTAAPEWNAGDLLVLVGDTFNSRVIVYSQSAVKNVLASPKATLSGPTSTVITSRQFLSLIAAPFGMDIYPADATHGVSLLFTTIDGRIIRYDTSAGAFTSNFASALGLGLTKIKVGSYAGRPYAFAAQIGLGSNGRILQFGAPPASGANKPVATITKGVSEPIGLALTTSGSTPASSCVAPSSCSPLGPQLTLQITGPGASRIPAGATVLQQACTIPNDPRVRVTGGVWSCLPSTMNVCGATPTPGCISPTLDVANFCPGFPSTILPATMCGHAGASGAAIQVVKATAVLLDENANDIYIQTTADPTVPLPGPYDLGCAQGIGQYGQMFAFAPRSDLPAIEGTIIEDAAAPYFMDITGFCDSGGGNEHVESMFAFGLGLNASASGIGTGATAGFYGFVNSKFNNLTTTVQDYSAQTTPQTVTVTLENYVTQSQNYFNSDYANDVNDYSCALNSIASADIYLRQQAAAMPNVFSYTAPAGGNNNPNPAGAIDARLANLFLTIAGDFRFAPNPTWPTTNVPPCVTLSVSSPLAVGGSGTLTFGPPATSTATPLLYMASQCTLSASDGTYATPMTVPASGSLSTGTLTKSGNYTATLECGGSNANTATSFATSTVAVSAQPLLQSIAVTPQGAFLQDGQTIQYTATGTYSSGPTQTLNSATWSTPANGIATVSSTGLAKCVTQGTTSVAASSGGKTGSVNLTCTAPSLSSITVAPAADYLPAGEFQQYTATGHYSDNSAQTLTAVTWAAGSFASITATGLATCLQQGNSSVTATSGNVSGSVTLVCTAPVLTAVTVSPNAASAAVGGTQTFTAAGTNSLNQPMTLSGVTWQSQSPAVATINAGSGVAACAATGTSIIKATSGSVSGTATLTCTPAPALASIAVTPTSASTLAGLTTQFGVTGKDALGNATSPGPVTWSVNNAIATVDNTGLATCSQSDAGIATITATSNSNSALTSSAQLTCSAASLVLSATPTTAKINTTVTLSWVSNLPASDTCALQITKPSTGATTMINGLSINGSYDVTDSVVETVNYLLSCQSTVNASSSVNVPYTVPTVYQYTGQLFTYGNAYAPYTTSDRVITSISLDGALPANQNDFDPRSLPGFSMTQSDGQQVLVGTTILSTAASGVESLGLVSTDTNGNITYWSFENRTPPGSNSGSYITTQSEAAANEGSFDSGVMNIGSGSDCAPTQQVPSVECGANGGSPGTWTSTNQQSLHVFVGTAAVMNAAGQATPGQLYEAVLGGTDSSPTFTVNNGAVGTILNQAPEPATCFVAAGTSPSGAIASLTSLAYLPNGDLVAANAGSSDVFRLSGPSFQPTSDIADASSTCSGAGASNVVVAASSVASGSMLGAGQDVTTGQQALYYFPPNPSGPPNYIYLDNVNDDPSLTNCASESGLGCVSSLVDAVGANVAVGGTAVTAGDLLVLVGDAYSADGNTVVLDFPNGKILAAAQGNCSTGNAIPCFANAGGVKLITQANLTAFALGESPVSLDMSSLDGSVFIATNLGNVYELTPNATGYGSAVLYATGLTAVQKIRVAVDPITNTVHVFTVQQQQAQGVVYEFVGSPPALAPSGAFSASSANVSGSGVASATIPGAAASLAVH